MDDKRLKDLKFISVGDTVKLTTGKGIDWMKCEFDKNARFTVITVYLDYANGDYRIRDSEGKLYYVYMDHIMKYIPTKLYAYNEPGSQDGTVVFNKHGDLSASRASAFDIEY